MFCSAPGILEYERDIALVNSTLEVTIDPRLHRFPNYGNQNTTLGCRVDGDVFFAYQWTFSGRHVRSNMRVSQGNGEFSVLTLVNPKSAYTGWYTCFAATLEPSSDRTYYATEAGFETAYVEVYGEPSNVCNLTVNLQSLLLIVPKKLNCLQKYSGFRLIGPPVKWVSRVIGPFCQKQKWIHITMT